MWTLSGLPEVLNVTMGVGSPARGIARSGASRRGCGHAGDRCSPARRTLTTAGPSARCQAAGCSGCPRPVDRPPTSAPGFGGSTASRRPRCRQRSAPSRRRGPRPRVSHASSSSTGIWSWQGRSRRCCQRIGKGRKERPWHLRSLGSPARAGVGSAQGDQPVQEGVGPQSPVDPLG
jgi:hypothetical protein